MRSVFLLDDDRATRLLATGLTVTETARQLGVSRQALHTAIRNGRVQRPAGGGGRGARIAEDGTPQNHACAGTNPAA